jgi:hypothetical protein
VPLLFLIDTSKGCFSRASTRRCRSSQIRDVAHAKAGAPQPAPGLTHESGAPDRFSTLGSAPGSTRMPI